MRDGVVTMRVSPDRRYARGAPADFRLPPTAAYLYLDIEIWSDQIASLIHPTPPGTPDSLSIFVVAYLSVPRMAGQSYRSVCLSGEKLQPTGRCVFRTLFGVAR